MRTASYIFSAHACAFSAGVGKVHQYRWMALFSCSTNVKSYCRYFHKTSILCTGTWSLKKLSLGIDLAMPKVTSHFYRHFDIKFISALKHCLERGTKIIYKHITALQCILKAHITKFGWIRPYLFSLALDFNALEFPFHLSVRLQIIPVFGITLLSCLCGHAWLVFLFRTTQIQSKPSAFCENISNLLPMLRMLARRQRK